MFIRSRKDGLNPELMSRSLDQRMDDPIPTFTYVVEKLKEQHPDLAYLHVVAPGAPANEGPEDESVSVIPLLLRLLCRGS